MKLYLSVFKVNVYTMIELAVGKPTMILVKTCKFLRLSCGLFHKILVGIRKKIIKSRLRPTDILIKITILGCIYLLMLCSKQSDHKMFAFVTRNYYKSFFFKKSLVVPALIIFEKLG